MSDEAGSNFSFHAVRHSPVTINRPTLSKSCPHKKPQIIYLRFFCSLLLLAIDLVNSIRYGLLGPFYAHWIKAQAFFAKKLQGMCIKG
ncbi:hypothetical protein ACWJJH_10010 [Endozoicomonadaceae bacterium StTr2]